jgi:hypothetical protein
MTATEDNLSDFDRIKRLQETARRHPNYGQTAPPLFHRRSKKLECQAKSHSRSGKPSREYREPYKDDDREFGSVTVKEFGQREFEESGAADNQNAVLIEFFSKPENQKKMFPMVDLQKLSGATRMNNRAIDLRRHFARLGWGVWNELQQYGPTGAMHSHYGLFPLEEVARRTRDRAAIRERRKLDKQGQNSF